MRYSKDGMIAWISAQRPSRHGCVFLDRDGVINERIVGGYVLHWADFRWRPGAIAAMRALSAAGLPLVVASNQSAVGRGLMTSATLVDIMRRMTNELDSYDIPLAAWYCCPHAPDAGCTCRKPGTAMLASCARDLHVNLSRSFLIGDSPSDIEAGTAAGCTSFLVEGADAAGLERIAQRIIARETAPDPV